MARPLKAITLDRLRRLGACATALETFRVTFGRSAQVTAANLRKAEKAGLTLDWLAQRLGLMPKHDYLYTTGDKRCAACDFASKYNGSNYDVGVRRLLLRAARG